jgi:transcriptional regulator with XRE-family HTH domain
MTTPVEPLSLIDIERLNALLNAHRERHGITSDEKLAHRLGVSSQAIYRWRRGIIDRSALALATLALEQTNADVEIAA